MNRGAVVVFARRPELGQVKSRLEQAIGKPLTLSLYRAFLADTLDAAHQSGATVVLAHTPGPDFPEQQLAQITFEQRGNSFAERFDAALVETAKRLPKGTPLIIVGADTPQLPPKFLRETLDVLNKFDTVIGESSKGGFYVLGFKSHPIPVAEAFSHPSNVSEEVVGLLRKAFLTTAFLERQFDVDLPQDLMKLIHLIDFLEAHDADWIPLNTRSALRNEGIVHWFPEITNAETPVGASRKLSREEP